MNEKMVRALEAALHYVLDTALRKVDSMYPHRDQMTMEYLMHRDCVSIIFAWFEQQVAGVRRLRHSFHPIRARSTRSYEEDEFCEEWDILLEFFGSPGTGWMMTIGLSSLPYNIRQLLVQMTQIIEVAFKGEIVQCLDDLKVLAHSLADPMDQEILKRITSNGQLVSNKSKIFKTC